METQTESIRPVVSNIGASSVSLESQTYSVAEAAQVLGVSMVTVYRLILRRVLRPLPLLRHMRIPKR
jgi:excisionase family DNA binding protein